ncbi:hypothetical protein D3C77_732350 [compost metagenome]
MSPLRPNGAANQNRDRDLGHSALAAYGRETRITQGHPSLDAFRLHLRFPHHLIADVQLAPLEALRG